MHLVGYLHIAVWRTVHTSEDKNVLTLGECIMCDKHADSKINASGVCRRIPENLSWRVDRLLLLVTCMKCIWNYMPEANHFLRVYDVASIQWFQFVVHVILFRTLNVLYFYISTCWSVCAVPIMAVFCSSVMCFAGMLLMYYYYYCYYYYYYYFGCEVLHNLYQLI